MRLKQINLAGFKSFVDPTQIPVPGQLVGVVGPNGCGKSNIIDAVRWVLGETSAKHLRGATMQDVLFNGSGERKPVNRATSLRNFMKMLMVTDGLLQPDATGGEAVAPVAAKAMQPGSGFIQTLPELQQNLTDHGFLLLNAALVFRPHVPPVKEAKAWRPLLETVLEALADRPGLAPPTLVLWGRIAQWLEDLPAVSRFPKAVAEHPYNLSFIQNRAMQDLFGPMHLLRAKNFR